MNPRIVGGILTAIAPSSAIVKPSGGKSRRRVVRALPVMMLVCSLLPAPAQAQFSQQRPKLVGSGALVGNGHVEEGWSVSLSHDGNTAIDNSIGAVWVFTRSNGVWSQEAKLVAEDPVGHAEQGYSVALSGDGNGRRAYGIVPRLTYSGNEKGSVPRGCSLARTERGASKRNWSLRTL
jgi:hypothetical protein